MGQRPSLLPGLELTHDTNSNWCHALCSCCDALCKVPIQVYIFLKISGKIDAPLQELSPRHVPNYMDLLTVASIALGTTFSVVSQWETFMQIFPFYLDEYSLRILFIWHWVQHSLDGKPMRNIHANIPIWPWWIFIKAYLRILYTALSTTFSRW